MEIETSSVRKYETEFAAHLLGRVAAMNADEVDYYLGLDEGYTQNDYVGREGAELAFESYLHGTPGERAVERNEDGKITSSVWLTDEETGGGQGPGAGRQRVPHHRHRIAADGGGAAGGAGARPQRRGEGAACTVQLVDTGEILAAASYPTFNLDTYVEDYAENSTDPLKPLMNRAFQGLYPPGSTFKMITAIAGLEEGIIEPSTIIRDLGRYTYWSTPQPMCWIYRQGGGTHGPVNVTRAIEVSCNYFMYDVGRRLH